jgi:hypothetical protein
MLLVAGGLLGALALVGLAVFGFSRLGGGRAVPRIEADARPVKVRPAAPGGLVVPNQNETIFDRPGERRAEAAAPAGRLAPAPEAPQIERLREELAAAPAAVPSPAAPAATAPAAPSAAVVPPRIAAARGTPAGASAAAPAPAGPVPSQTATVTSPAGPAGRARIQIGALGSEEAARTEWDRLVRRVPELAGRQPQISRFDREGQPTLWRLRTGGFADAAAARAACEAVRAKGAAPCSLPGA